MTFSNLIKQPWFQALVALALLVLVLVGAYYYGKSAGRGDKATEFDKRQAELLKKSQDSLALADAAARRAEESEFYAAKLKEIIASDRKNAAETEARVTAVYQNSIKEINEKYETDKTSILGDMPACDRCRDLCRRANELAAYGPEFASYKCNPATECAAACDSRDPQGP